MMDFNQRPDLRPIPTRYNGYNFRSRLEARWAVVFDRLRIPYEYEAQGFKTEHGYYLPDFYLPTLNRLVEIKPQAHTNTELQHAILKSMRQLFSLRLPAMLIEGTPGVGFCDYWVHQYDEFEGVWQGSFVDESLNVTGEMLREHHLPKKLRDALIAGREARFDRRPA